MKDIKLHNTLSRQTETYVPIHPGEAYMYHCGPTVYNYLHIGNLRAYLLADTLRRTFEANGYKVKQVINITDVGHLTADNDEGLGDDGEDKMERMAKASGKTAWDIAKFYTDVFMSDIKDLNVRTEGTIFPKATDNIPEQIAIIRELEAKGLTYRTSDGIYLTPPSFRTMESSGLSTLRGFETEHASGKTRRKGTLPISPSGSFLTFLREHPSETRSGSLRGEWDFQAGTSSALRCQRSTLARPSISILAGSITSRCITITRSPSRNLLMTLPLPTTGSMAHS